MKCSGVELQSLDNIALSNTKNVTDAGIKELAALPKLKTLIVLFSTVDGSAFKAFADWKTLQYLDLTFVEGLTDEGVKNLAKMPSLTHLYLPERGNNSKVTSA